MVWSTCIAIETLSPRTVEPSQTILFMACWAISEVDQHSCGLQTDKLVDREREKERKRETKREGGRGREREIKRGQRSARVIGKGRGREERGLLKPPLLHASKWGRGPYFERKKKRMEPLVWKEMGVWSFFLYIYFEFFKVKSTSTIYYTYYFLFVNFFEWSQQWLPTRSGKIWADPHSMIEINRFGL